MNNVEMLRVSNSVYTKKKCIILFLFSVIIVKGFNLDR
jgi:hypothetical protein